MIGAWTLFLNIFVFLTVSVQAAEITTFSDSSLSLKSIADPNSSFRPLQFCEQGSCELIPSQEILLLQAFAGRDLSWDEVFNQCRNFQSLNELVLWTQILSSLAASIQPITALRQLQATKQILAGWGLLGRVAGRRIVFETGVSIGGQVIYSIPIQLVDSGEPYPEVAPEDVELVSNLLEDVLSDRDEVYFLPAEMIHGLVSILRGCTSQLKSHYLRQDVQTCLSGCHSLDKKTPLQRAGRKPGDNKGQTPKLWMSGEHLEQLFK